MNVAIWTILLQGLLLGAAFSSLTSAEDPQLLQSLLFTDCIPELTFSEKSYVFGVNC